MVSKIEVVSELGEIGQNLSNDIFGNAEMWRSSNELRVIERAQGRRSASIVPSILIDHRLLHLHAASPSSKMNRNFSLVVVLQLAQRAIK